MTLATYFEEKNLPFAQWELTADDGMDHVISNEVVIEYLLSNLELGRQALPTILKIDRLNGNVNDFLRHIAGFIINR